jgi:hypothetical protein
MFQAISELGDIKSHIFLLAICFNVISKPAFLYLGCQFAFLNYLSQLLISVYNQPRPFWVSEQITSDKCYMSLGNPADTLMTNSFLLLSLYLHKYYEVGIPRKRMSVMCTAYIVKMALTCLGSVFLIFLAFS